MQTITYTDTEYIQKVSNHPVHVVDSQHLLSPSASIPFCALGDDMNILGQSVPNFSIPTCNKFRPIMLEGQQCYQLDVDEFSTDMDRKQKSQGLVFMMDYNEDRAGLEAEGMNEVLNKKGLIAMQGNDARKNEAMIYIKTLGI